MYQRTTLANGLRVLTASMPHTRSVTAGIYVGAGSRYEPDAEAGLSHFLEHMLFKGTERHRTAREIAEAIESVGGVHNAATDREATAYWAKVPATSAFDVLDILCDMVTAPLLEPVEMEKERHVILEELAMIEDSPGEIASVLIDEILWPTQPLGREIGGTPETVRDMPLAAVRAYFARQYVPDNLVLAVAGQVAHDEVVEAAERWMTGLPATEAGTWFRREERPGAPRLGVRGKPTEQAHFCLAYPAYPLRHPDQYTLDLVSAMLGDGMSSRLFLTLREDRALVYDVHTYAQEYRDAGALTVYAGCDPDAAHTTVEATLEEIGAFLRDVDEKELEKARRMLQGRLQLRMEDTRAVVGWLGSQELLLDEVLTVDEAVERLERVTLDDVRRVGADILSPEQAHLAVVGPFEDGAAFEPLVA